MLVLIDDIKMRDEGEFLSYINTTFADKEITDLDMLYDYLLQTDKEIELLVSDYNEIEDKTFASKVLKVLTLARDARANIKLTMM
ncbi:MAG: hypothetical protein IJH80_04035 [Ruminococcus sp.]|nr:hypothetical protein [Ruminococcus sp.]